MNNKKANVYIYKLFICISFYIMNKYKVMKNIKFKYLIYIKDSKINSQIYKK